MTQPAQSVAAAVHAEEVGAVFRQMPIALAVNLVNAALTTAVLAPLAARAWLLPWLMVMVAVTTGRGVLWLCCRRVPIRPDNARYWSRLAAGFALLTGLGWGIGGAVLFPIVPLSGQIFLTTVIAGMCAGAAVVSAAHLPTLLAFVLSASLPMAVRFLTAGSSTNSALGAMILVFAVALTLAGRHLNRIFGEALRLRFELNEANLRLHAEIAEHQATEAALHQAQKLEALGHLTGGIAHDFNNLLTVVMSNAALLRERATDEPTRRRAAAILAIAERGERLTRQLLTFSRRRLLRPETVALPQRVGEIGELFARSLREDIAVTIDVPEDLWPMAVDPGEFELALLNISLNGRDAMPEGGAFRLEARNRRCGGGLASGGLDGDFVAITLSDTGTGMPAEVRARAFEPYFTTKGSGLGSGLGLSQVYGFASQSGGTAVIASEPGQGTAITLFLPRATAPALRSPAAAGPASAVAAAHILLVEDDREVATAARELLRHMGFETQWAGDSGEALRLIEGGLPVDLVLSDVVMPGGMSGLDLARRLRGRLPIVLATGYSQYAAQVVEEGFVLIEKPYRRDRLAAALRAAFAGGRPAV